MSDEATPTGPPQLRLSEHPRATRQIQRAKAWGGLSAFALTLLLSLRAHLPLDGALQRALPAAIAGYVACWIVAVAAWRHLAAAELELARRRILARVEELQAEAEAGT